MEVKVMSNNKNQFQPVKNFNSHTQKLIKKSDIKFIDNPAHRITLVSGEKVPLIYVRFRGTIRCAIEK